MLASGRRTAWVQTPLWPFTHLKLEINLYHVRSIYVRADGTYSNRCAVSCPQRRVQLREVCLQEHGVCHYSRNNCHAQPQRTPSAASPKLGPLTADSYSAGQGIPILSRPQTFALPWPIASAQHIIFLISNSIIFFHLRLVLPTDFFIYDIPTKM